MTIIGNAGKASDHFTKVVEIAARAYAALETPTVQEALSEARDVVPKAAHAVSKLAREFHSAYAAARP